MIEKIIDQISKIEKKRRDALWKRDAISYYTLCNELGIKPEDEWLYEIGLMEISNEKEEINNLIREVEKESKKEIYKKFLNETYSYRLNIKDFFDNIKIKKELLKKYFPKFRRKAKQDLDKYEPEQIGKIFYEIVRYAEKSIE